jgi:S1-C subfamily serine protease
MSRWIFAAPALVVAGVLLLSAPGAGQRVPPSGSGLVRIETASCGARLVGTGFLVDSRHVATAEHVVTGATRIVLRRSDGAVLGAGTIAGADRGLDVALIRSDRAISGHVFSLSGRSPRAGERLSALRFGSSAAGRMRGFARLIGASGGRAGQALIQTDASVEAGDSGGPLVSAHDGSVLGLVDLSASAPGGPSFAVEARAARPLLSRWRHDPEAVPQRRCAR